MSAIVNKKVSVTHPDYDKHIEYYRRCRAVNEGEDAVKDLGEEVLPMLDEQDTGEYDAYRMRATFFEATGRTVQGLVGAVFRKPPNIEFPESKKDLLDNVGKFKESFTTIAEATFEEVIVTGRHMLLIDAAETENFNPYVVGYTAESIINWRYSMDNEGRYKMSLIVLKETVTEEDEEDEFDIEEVEQYRVLKLVEGVYTVEVYREVEDNDERANAKGESGPRFEMLENYPMNPKVNGKTLDYIPTVFFTPSGPVPLVEKPPILGLANMNLSHYRSSADIEHGCHFTALPTGWVSTDGDMKEAVPLGSSHIVKLPANSTVGFWEFGGAGLASIEKRAEKKAEYMAILGARFLEPPRPGVEAAETHLIRRSSEDSVLASVANATSEGLSIVLKILADWVHASTDKINCTLNTDFIVGTIDPAFGSMLMDWLQSGKISYETFFWHLQQGEVIPEGRSMEEELDLIEARPQTPPSLPLDQDPNNIDKSVPPNQDNNQGA